MESSTLSKNIAGNCRQKVQTKLSNDTPGLQMECPKDCPGNAKETVKEKLRKPSENQKIVLKKFSILRQSKKLSKESTENIPKKAPQNGQWFRRLFKESPKDCPKIRSDDCARKVQETFQRKIREPSWGNSGDSLRIVQQIIPGINPETV